MVFSFLSVVYAMVQTHDVMHIKDYVNRLRIEEVEPALKGFKGTTQTHPSESRRKPRVK